MLRHITTTACPCCGSTDVVSEEMEHNEIRGEVRVHCNGERWETRKFVCGHAVSWVPNFSREEVRSACHTSPEIILRNQKREQARDALKNFIAALDVDGQWKRGIHLPA